MGLFNRQGGTRGVTIDAVTLDVLEWENAGATPTQKVWSSPFAPDVLTLVYRPSPPEIPYPLSATDRLRAHFETLLRAGDGVLLTLDHTQVAGCDALEQLVTFPLATHTGWRVSVGTVTLPFAAFSMTVKVECPQTSPDGDAPLTRCREALAHIRTTTRVSERLRRATPYRV